MACLACGWHTRWRGLLAQLTLLCVCKKTRGPHRDRVRDDDDDVIAASFIITDKRAGTVFRDWGRADDNRYLRKQSLKPRSGGLDSRGPSRRRDSDRVAQGNDAPDSCLAHHETTCRYRAAHKNKLPVVE